MSPRAVRRLKDHEPKLTLAESTVHRLLARRGLMKKRPDEPTAKGRRFEACGTYPGMTGQGAARLPT